MNSREKYLDELDARGLSSPDWTLFQLALEWLFYAFACGFLVVCAIGFLLLARLLWGEFLPQINIRLPRLRPPILPRWLPRWMRGYAARRD